MDVTNDVLSYPRTSDGLPYLPNMRAMARSMQLKRKGILNAPSIPKEWEEMIVPEQYSTTLDGEHFLILDQAVPGKSIKVWGWASNTGISIMKAANHIYGDGTFEICKETKFMQAWVMVAKCSNIKVTL